MADRDSPVTHRAGAPPILFLDAHRHPELIGKEAHRLREPHLERALDELGFRPCGELLSVPLHAGENSYFEASDRADHEAAMDGVITVPMVSPDGTCFATAERAFKNDSLRLRSLLATGDIVETRLAWSRFPRVKCSVDPELEPAVNRIADTVVGVTDDRLWPNLPAAGLHRANIARESATELWARHRDHVRTISRRLRSSTVEHTSLALFLAITRRGWHVQSWHSTARNALVGPFGLMVMAALSLAGVKLGVVPGQEPWFTIAVPVYSLAMAMVLNRVADDRQAGTGHWLVGSVASAAAGSLAGYPFWPLCLAISYFSLVWIARPFWEAILLHRTGWFVRWLPIPRRVQADKLLDVYPEPDEATLEVAREQLRKRRR
jgi:hypothetical protein